MKSLTTLIILFSLQASATNYYVSASGNDNNPGTQASPFKTINKAISVMASGDSILLKGGDTFYGTVNGKSGMNLSSYGTGKAIIEGFQTLTLAQSGNLYTANLSTQTYMVIVDGQFKPYGRSPKSGYYNCTASGTNTITGNFSGNYVGGEVVWRPYHWVLWRGMVSQQSGSTITYQPFPSTSGGPVYPAKVNYGFFFQNNPSLCNQLGEWSCVGTKFSVWLDKPRVVRAAIVENLINLNGLSNVSISNLIIQGANGNSIYLPASKNIKIDRCEVYFAGKNFVYGNSSCSNISITNSNFDYANSNGFISNSVLFTITGNTINHVGAIAGMGGSGEGQYFVTLNVKSSTVSNNTIRNFGYNGICFQGNNNIIKNNFLDSFCFVKDDGAAIYCGGYNFSGTVVTGNVITNGLGATAGTPDINDPRAYAVYVDDGGSNVEISFNTCVYNAVGLYTHNSHELNIHDNLIVDSKTTGIKYYNDGNTIRNISLVNNTFYNHSGSTLSRASGGSSSIPGFFSSADFNYWNPGKVFMTGSATYDLPGWRNYIGKEANSKTLAVSSTTIFQFNPTNQNKTVALSGNYQDVKGNVYAGSITLPPYTGILLAPTAVQPPPTTYTSQPVSQTMSTICTNGSGISATYMVPAGKYSSTVSQADANAKAKSEIDTWWTNLITNCGCKN